MWPKLHALELLGSIGSRSFNTLPFLSIDVPEWAEHSEHLLDAVLRADLGPLVVIRSCAALEDTAEHEPPGFFESVLNVPADDREALRRAIETVLGSYGRRPGAHLLAHKVLVQRQLLKPRLAGVCRIGPLERDYIDIDYDDTLGRTDAVTAGVRAKRLSLSACKGMLPQPWLALRQAANQLRRHFEPPFFLEFAMDGSGRPTIFQVRPDRRPSVERAAARLPSCVELHALGSQLRQTGPLSVMADWNPAEMLGVAPLPLDISLYEKLLMDGAWAEGRTSVGWRAPSERGLMTLLGGRPYVKLAVSLETLLPRGLAAKLARRLVRDRLQLLSGERQLHDKVEFRLMWSAFAFDTAVVEAELRGRGFSAKDVRQLFEALKQVTRQAVEGAPAALADDCDGLRHIAAARQRLAAERSLASPQITAGKIRTALKVCRRYGTGPFSRQARLAFTFRYMINYLVEAGALPQASLAHWESGLNTVARQLGQALRDLQQEKLSRESFNDRYGHLRPSSYNLESPRYDECRFAGFETSAPGPQHGGPPLENPALAALLREVGLSCAQLDFWDAAAGAFRGREELKFAFTALLSDILRLLADVAREAGLERRDLRLVSIADILGTMDRTLTWKTFRRDVKSVAREEPALRRLLPDVLFEPRDLHVIFDLDARPTFIGVGSAQGPARLITADTMVRPSSLSGAVVGIECPDPGYDWIFAYPIAGLVSAYGGEFSHMGLRCAEFGIPAAIGCGARLFAAAVQARELRIDSSACEVWADCARLFPS